MKTLLISLALFINPIIPNESDEIIEEVKKTSYDQIFQIYYWTKCISGLYGKDCKQGKAKVMNWYESVKYCENLKLSNKKWKLPKFSDGFINYDDRNKGIIKKLDKSNKKKIQTNSLSENYWYSDTDLANSDYAIYGSLSLTNGFGYTVSKKSKAYVRCVSTGEKKQVEERIEIEELKTEDEKSKESK